MKKLCILLSILSMLFILPISVSADQAGVSGTSQASGETNLAIDDSHIYAGMDKAYDNGYSPSVQNGVATVILPLVATSDIKGNTITATPSLGDASSSPFVFENYQKTVNLGNNAVNGGGIVSSYLVRFDLTLASGRINGAYPVTINVQAQGTDGTPIQESFTTYVIITDGKNPTAASSSSAPSSQPKVIVSSYSINPSPAVAGNELTANVTLKNTSSTENVQNMTVTASCESTDFSLQNSSNTFFIDNIGKGGTKTIQLKYKTNLETPAQQFNITLAIAYDSADATGLTATGTISVIVTQSLRVELQTPQIPESVNAGDTLPLTLQVMNMGHSKIFNVRCELSAPGLIPSGIVFIGNMDAGTSSNSEMDILIGTKIMSKDYTGTDQYGLTNGKITLTYEDENGKVYTQDTTISTTIKPPVVTSSSQTTKKQAKTGQWWISIVIGCVVIAGLAAVLVIRKKKESHHEDI
jgi:hypothetical protein